MYLTRIAQIYIVEIFNNNCTTYNIFNIAQTYIFNKLKSLTGTRVQGEFIEI